jgi:HD-GYP domain-containing protein (c-di-GMP phosphodiesterase class II)
MLDGSGYPKHVKADNIPLQARIIAVADIFEALIAKDRPYKKGIDLVKSLDILKQEVKNGRLDKELVRIFIENAVYEKKADD